MGRFFVFLQVYELFRLIPVMKNYKLFPETIKKEAADYKLIGSFLKISKQTV